MPDVTNIYNIKKVAVRNTTPLPTPISLSMFSFFTHHIPQ